MFSLGMSIRNHTYLKVSVELIKHSRSFPLSIFSGSYSDQNKSISSLLQNCLGVSRDNSQYAVYIVNKCGVFTKLGS